MFVSWTSTQCSLSEKKKTEVGNSSNCNTYHFVQNVLVFCLSGLSSVSAGTGCVSAVGGQPSTFEPLQHSGGPCWHPDSTRGVAQRQGVLQGTLTCPPCYDRSINIWLNELLIDGSCCMKLCTLRCGQEVYVMFLSTLPLQLLPSLYEAGRTCASDGDMVNSILTDTATALTDEFQRSIQVHI